MPKITPFLWFDDNAEEAMAFYTAVFPNSSIGEIHRFGAEVPGPEGKALYATMTLDGTDVMVLNGGPYFSFTEAISLYVDCQDQGEVDYYWDALTADGGEPSQCGWLKDKFGLSWQIVPSALEELSTDPNPAKAAAVTQAMLKMTKIDVAKLQEAYDQA